jgi:hypothetical protein
VAVYLKEGFEGLLHGASGEGNDRIFYDATVDFASLDFRGSLSSGLSRSNNRYARISINIR